MPEDTDLLALTADVTSAFVGNNEVTPAEVPALIASIHAALAGLGTVPAAEAPPEPQPQPAAVTVRKSLADPAKIVSMIDGKPYSTLTRHLTAHGYTPQTYRERYGLRADYPMVAPAYSEARRAIAATIGLGSRQRPTASVPAPAPVAAAPAEAEVLAPKPRRGRPAKPKVMSGAEALASVRASS